MSSLSEIEPELSTSSLRRKKLVCFIGLLVYQIYKGSEIYIDPSTNEVYNEPLVRGVIPILLHGSSVDLLNNKEALKGGFTDDIDDGTEYSILLYLNDVYDRLADDGETQNFFKNSLYSYDFDIAGELEHQPQPEPEPEPEPEPQP